MERFSALIPKTGQRTVRLSGIILLSSLLISGVSAYVTLAAPANLPFVPTTVAFQGQLLDDLGNPVPDANYSLTFSLYDQPSGANLALWTETQPTVSVIKGIYSVQLGSMPGTSLPPTAFDGQRWLGVRVGASTNPEMTPRIPISAVPFALNAHEAQGIQGYPVSTAVPGSGQILAFDAINNNWGPATGASSVPSVRVYHTSNQATNTNAAWKTLLLGTERWDTADLHSGTNGYFTATSAGKYLIFASVEFQYNTKNQRFIQFLVTPYVGTVRVIAYEVRDAIDDEAGPTRMTLTTVYHLGQNDKVELQVKQNRGGALSILSAGNYSPEFGMVRIGD